MSVSQLLGAAAIEELCKADGGARGWTDPKSGHLAKAVANLLKEEFGNAQTNSSPPKRMIWSVIGAQAGPPGVGDRDQ